MLNEKVAIITGGTRGIGYAIVKKYLDNGAKVAVLGSREETVNKALAQLEKEGYNSDRYLGFWPDLLKIEEIEKTVAEVLEKWGKIDILVNNAGISQHLPILMYPDHDFEKIMDLNVTALFNFSKVVVKTMKEQKSGVILNTSSMVSLYGQPSGVGYPTSKFAVNGFTKSLARELGPDNIRVNAVAPGVIETDMVKALKPEQIEPIIARIPLRRVGQPEDIANAFLYLASDMASYVTGVVLSVDGATLV